MSLGRPECKVCLQDNTLTKLEFTGNYELWRCGSCAGICVVDVSGNQRWYSFHGSVVRA